MPVKLESSLIYTPLSSFEFFPSSTCWGVQPTGRFQGLLTAPY